MAYYGKLDSIDGTILVVNIICSEFHVREWKIIHRVDNQVALTNCFGLEEPDTSTLGFSLVKKIRASIWSSGIQWVGKK